MVWRHYRRAGRHTLPWRRTRDPYRVVVSEVMLQQTQVVRVLKFYPRFLARFPSFRALARAPRREVLRLWQGLGYNRRAVALHRLAREVVARHRGALPRHPEALEALPGVGPATAGAIAAFAFNTAVPFIETNIRRAIIFHFFPRASRVSESAVLAVARAVLVRTRPREWHYALMDYGAWLAARTENPNRRHEGYRRQPKFRGSSRELRGEVVRYVLAHPRATAREVARALGKPLTRVGLALAALRREGVLE